MFLFDSMKMSDNKLTSVLSYFHLKLDDLYPELEVDSMFWILVEWYSKFSKLDFMKDPDLRFHEGELLDYMAFVRRLLKFEPVQYITGNTDFFGLNIKVNKHVLIPRPETEELVSWVIETVKNKDSIHLLDIGTGSGCIPLALKSKLKLATVVGADISDDALNMARDNARSIGLDVEFSKLNALELGDELNGFNIIVSNPPYIKYSEKQLMRDNVLKFEPHLALFVDNEDPLLFYRSISTAALKSLPVGGLLFFEVNEAHAFELERLLFQMGFNQVEVRNDIFDKPRMIKATK